VSLLMKHRAPTRGRTSAAERRARLQNVVRQARASGKTVPSGVKLIGFRELKPTEIARGKTLEKIARASLSRRKAVA